MDIEIRETTASDLPHVMELWNNGQVMRFVGFPQGLGTTVEKLTAWLGTVNQDDGRRHYSIYTPELGYCGETFYSVDRERGLAELDIKLLPKAQGQGIAKYALAYSIRQVFSKKLASRAYVDPHPDNRAAWALYDRLGFESAPRPAHLEEWPSYLEVRADTWRDPFAKGEPGANA